jgi:hypothetical protein
LTGVFFFAIGWPPLIFAKYAPLRLNLLTAKILLLSKKFATEFAHERGDPE